MRLFLSYSRKDRRIIEDLATVLRNGGQEVWIDDQIRAGTRWRVALRKAIEQSDGIVLALTPNWIDSPYCQWEFITAAELGKKVIPVLLSKTDIPARISQYQYAKFVDGFTDADRVQGFLDDLLVLAAEIDIDAVDMSSKLELERQIDQQIQTENITDSTIDATQKADGTEEGRRQHIATGDISGSTITFNQVTTTVGNQTIKQGEKQRNWTIPVVVGLLLALVSTVAAVVALLPQPVRDNLLFSVGMISASLTPSPTATATLAPSPTPLPTPTLTPTPQPLPAAGFNVVVGGFAYRNSAGVIEQNRLADNMSDIVAVELNQITQIDNTLGWRSNGVGRILGQTPPEREAQAAVIAETLNADVVIYGIVSSDGIFSSFEPEFYITAKFASLEPEIVGADSLGNRVEFVGNSEDQILAANTFQRRLGVMRLFLRGLAFYLAGNFVGAQESFEEALQIESEGLEVLYIFAGNAAIRIPDAARAIEFYNDALRQRPEYARALIGRGISLYRIARQSAGDSPPPYDSDLTLDLKQACADVEADLPDSPQLLAELALRCYREAQISPDQPNTADIDVKTAFGLGQTSLWLSLNEYGDYWSDVELQLIFVKDSYNTSSEARQNRIRAATGHAHAWLGLRLLSLDGNNPKNVCAALNYYRQGVALLREDVNREYNQRWIDLYGQQVSALEDWLDDRDADCSGELDD